MAPSCFHSGPQTPKVPAGCAGFWTRLWRWGFSTWSFCLGFIQLGSVRSNEDFLVGFGAWGCQSSSVLPPEHVWWPPAGARLWGCTGRTRGMCPRMFLISSAFSSDYGARELCDCWPCHLCHLSLQAGLLRVLRAGWKPGSFGSCAQTIPGLFYNVSDCR